MKREHLKEGTYGVVLTPFDSDGRLIAMALRRELRHCVGDRTRGLVICGSTGEFVYMDTAQQKEVLRIAAEEVGNKKILIGGGSAATESGVRNLLQYISRLGYEYAMICPPYYYPQRPEDILSFYEKISETAPPEINILMYNIPFCAPEIPLIYMDKLMSLPNIIGMKDSSGNMQYFSKVMALALEIRPEFALFTGQDCTFLPSLSIGAKGCMSALSWILDGVMADILEAYQKNELKKAAEMQLKITRLVRHLDGIAFPENYRILSEVIGVHVGMPQRSLHNLNAEFCSQWIARAAELVTGLGVK